MTSVESSATGRSSPAATDTSVGAVAALQQVTAVVVLRRIVVIALSPLIGLVELLLLLVDCLTFFNFRATRALFRLVVGFWCGGNAGGGKAAASKTPGQTTKLGLTTGDGTGISAEAKQFVKNFSSDPSLFANCRSTSTELVPGMEGYVPFLVALNGSVPHTARPNAAAEVSPDCGECSDPCSSFGEARDDAVAVVKEVGPAQQQVRVYVPDDDAGAFCYFCDTMGGSPRRHFEFVSLTPVAGEKSEVMNEYGSLLELAIRRAKTDSLDDDAAEPEIIKIQLRMAPHLEHEPISSAAADSPMRLLDADRYGAYYGDSQIIDEHGSKYAIAFKSVPSDGEEDKFAGLLVESLDVHGLRSLAHGDFNVKSFCAIDGCRDVYELVLERNGREHEQRTMRVRVEGLPVIADGSLGALHSAAGWPDRFPISKVKQMTVTGLAGFQCYKDGFNPEETRVIFEAKLVDGNGVSRTVSFCCQRDDEVIKTMAVIGDDVTIVEIQGLGVDVDGFRECHIGYTKHDGGEDYLDVFIYEEVLPPLDLSNFGSQDSPLNGNDTLAACAVEFDVLDSAYRDLYGDLVTDEDMTGFEACRRGEVYVNFRDDDVPYCSMKVFFKKTDDHGYLIRRKADVYFEFDAVERADNKPHLIVEAKEGATAFGSHESPLDVDSQFAFAVASGVERIGDAVDVPEYGAKLSDIEDKEGWSVRCRRTCSARHVDGNGKAYFECLCCLERGDEKCRASMFVAADSPAGKIFAKEFDLNALETYPMAHSHGLIEAFAVDIDDGPMGLDADSSGICAAEIENAGKCLEALNDCSSEIVKIELARSAEDGERKLSNDDCTVLKLHVRKKVDADDASDSADADDASGSAKSGTQRGVDVAYVRVGNSELDALNDEFERRRLLKALSAGDGTSIDGTNINLTGVTVSYVPEKHPADVTIVANDRFGWSPDPFSADGEQVIRITPVLNSASGNRNWLADDGGLAVCVIERKSGAKLVAKLNADLVYDVAVAQEAKRLGELRQFSDAKFLAAAELASAGRIVADRDDGSLERAKWDESAKVTQFCPIANPANTDSAFSVDDKIACLIVFEDAASGKERCDEVLVPLAGVYGLLVGGLAPVVAWPGNVGNGVALEAEKNIAPLADLEPYLWRHLLDDMKKNKTEVTAVRPLVMSDGTRIIDGDGKFTLCSVSVKYHSLYGEHTATLPCVRVPTAYLIKLQILAAAEIGAGGETVLDGASCDVDACISDVGAEIAKIVVKDVASIDFDNVEIVKFQTIKDSDGNLISKCEGGDECCACIVSVRDKLNPDDPPVRHVVSVKKATIEKRTAEIEAARQAELVRLASLPTLKHDSDGLWHEDAEVVEWKRFTTGENKGVEQLSSSDAGVLVGYVVREIAIGECHSDGESVHCIVLFENGGDKKVLELNLGSAFAANLPDKLKSRREVSAAVKASGTVADDHLNAAAYGGTIGAQEAEGAATSDASGSEFKLGPDERIDTFQIILDPIGEPPPMADRDADGNIVRVFCLARVVNDDATDTTDRYVLIGVNNGIVKGKIDAAAASLEARKKGLEATANECAERGTEFLDGTTKVNRTATTSKFSPATHGDISSWDIVERTEWEQAAAGGGTETCKVVFENKVSHDRAFVKLTRKSRAAYIAENTDKFNAFIAGLADDGLGSEVEIPSETTAFDPKKDGNIGGGWTVAGHRESPKKSDYGKKLIYTVLLEKGDDHRTAEVALDNQNYAENLGRLGGCNATPEWQAAAASLANMLYDFTLETSDIPYIDFSEQNPEDYIIVAASRKSSTCKDPCTLGYEWCDVALMRKDGTEASPVVVVAYRPVAGALDGANRDEANRFFDKKQELSDGGLEGLGSEVEISSEDAAFDPGKDGNIDDWTFGGHSERPLMSINNGEMLAYRVLFTKGDERRVVAVQVENPTYAERKARLITNENTW
ncbi:MAG: hypothetical protein LBB38_03135, partial [Puniceicoccales bacterium]|nr:hypothetical protein [Puniceicoccales bacterium]